MKITLTPMSPDDREPVMDIFNYYIENSYAAYPEQKLPYEFFDIFLSMCQGYPTAIARNESGETIGFGLLRPYNPLPAFSRTAEITYFLKPEFTGRGIGKAILNHLIDEGKKQGLTTILASISSLNEWSIHFHKKHGFVECGHFKKICRKNGKVFDIVYMQKML